MASLGALAVPKTGSRVLAWAVGSTARDKRNYKRANKPKPKRLVNMNTTTITLLALAALLTGCATPQPTIQPEPDGAKEYDALSGFMANELGR